LTLLTLLTYLLFDFLQINRPFAHSRFGSRRGRDRMVVGDQIDIHYLLQHCTIDSV
jgi:hypothetical protein